VGLVALVLGGGPAAADPPRPTDYRSQVIGVAPEVPGLRAEVVGGDAFLELHVDEDVTAVVEGYGEEPYLRFRRDGTVQRNTRSPATYLNEDRQGNVALPAAADDTAEPEWETVAHGGVYAWHDHRIHWMGGNRPPGARPGDVVQSWTVPLTVDGTRVEVTGELVLEDRVLPVPWIALGVAAALTVAALGRRRALAPVVAVAAAAVAAVGVGWAQYSSAPAGSGANPLLVAVPVVGLAAAGLGVALRHRAGGAVAVLAGAAAVVGWGLLRVEVLWMPVLPTELSPAVDRAATALTIGLAAAGAVAVVWSGGLVPRLDLPGGGPGPPPGPGDDPAPGPGAAPAPEGRGGKDHGPGAGPGAADAAATRGGGGPR
jgi:hypothetical protein